MYPSANAATPFIFPRPLNATFTTAFWNSPSRRNSTKNETDNLLRSAAYDLRRPFWGLGSNWSELHAGDMVYAKWKGDSVIDLAWYCLMCTLGVETGDVWGACEYCKDTSYHYDICYKIPQAKMISFVSTRSYSTSPAPPLSSLQNVHPVDTYTDTKSVSTFISTAPNHGPFAGPMIAPSFSKWNTPTPPEETCGLCFLTQFEDHLSWANTGYTIPFPVFAAYRTPISSGKQFDNFSKENPAGILPLSLPKATSIPSIPDMAPKGRGGRIVSNNAAVIAGSIFGVGVLLILLWSYLRWRRDAKNKNLARASTSTNNVEMGRTRPMVRRGVESRPDSMVSEPPPAYHEVVRDGERQA